MRHLGILALLGVAACGPTQVASTTQAPGHRSTVAIEGVGSAEITRSRTDNNTRVAIPIDLLWAQLPAVYDELGLTGGGVLNASEHTFTRRNRRIVRRLGDLQVSRIVNCGTSIHGDPNAYEVILTATTGLVADGNGTIVSTSLEAQGQQIGSSNTPVQCGSTGILEQRIVQMLQHRAAASAS